MISNRLRLFILIDSLLISVNCLSQSLSENVELESQLESLIFTNNSGDNDIEYSVDDLVDNLKYKVDLNIVDAQVLTELFILSPAQIQAILEYRKRVGRFKSVYELQFVYALDRETLAKLTPFVYVDELSTMGVNKWLGDKLFFSHELSSRLSIPFYKRVGDKSQFLGPAVYNNIRYKGKLNENIEFGFVGEKDSGEPLFALNNKWGYDHCSYYLMLKNINNIKVACFGLFRAEFGLGLVLGMARFGGKWNAIQSFFKSGSSLTKHGSVSETNYFRGLASIYKIKKFELTSLFSHVAIDGSIKDNQVRSLSKTGLHRISKDFVTKHNVKLLTLGQRISYLADYFSLGFNGIYYQFNRPLSASNLKSKIWDIQGNNFYNLSFDYSLYLSKLMFKGEIAKGKKGIALLNKIYYSPNFNWDLLLIYRFYSYDYWGYFASAFGNQTSVKNENGWYLNIQTSQLSPLLINLYLDFCSYPWQRYRVSSSSKSFDTGFALDYSIHQNQKLSFKASYKSSIRDISESKSKKQEPFKRYKIHLDYTIDLLNKKLISKTMCDYIGVNSSIREGGYAFTQRLTYTYFFIGFSLQYSYFDTSSFDSRIYIYEKNLLYSPSISSFSGCGHRCSCLMNCKINKSLSLYFKYGMTCYSDRNFIGGGLDKTIGNKRSDLSIMGRFKF